MLKKKLACQGFIRFLIFLRISEIASNKKDNIRVNLSFYLKNNKTPCVDGIIHLDIVLACQRCLDDLSIALQVNFNLAFVRHNQESEELDSHYEIYVIEDEELATHDLISDEILLSVPMVPTHDYDCIKEIKEQQIVERKSENPFAILKENKNSR